MTKQFKKVFRMSRDSFKYPLDIYIFDISRFKEEDFERDNRSHRTRSVTMDETKIAIFLWLMAVGYALYDCI